MSFTLEVTFHGLCLFTPDPTSTPRRMFVLMTRTPRGPAVPEHLLTVAYDGPAVRLDPGEELRFTNLADGGVSPVLPAGIVDLTAAQGMRVGRDTVEANPRSDLRSRVVLTDGQLERTGGEACWLFGPRKEPMTDRVRLRTTVPADSLAWEVRDFAGNLLRPLPGAAPGGDGVVRIDITHMVPCHDECASPVPRPSNGHEPEHFQAFHALLDGAASLPLPQLTDCDDDEGQIRAIAHRLIGRLRVDGLLTQQHTTSASLYSCMVAGAQLALQQPLGQTLMDLRDLR
jgi:hypothetical protein